MAPAEPQDKVSPLRQIDESHALRADAGESLIEGLLFTPGHFLWIEADTPALWMRYDMWTRYEEHAADLEARR